MRFDQEWQGIRLADGFRFDAHVPGSIQLDYARAKSFGDVSDGENFRKFKAIEATHGCTKRARSTAWSRRALYCISRGTTICLIFWWTAKRFFLRKGMFTPVGARFDGRLAPGGLAGPLKIYPHPSAPTHRTRIGSRRISPVKPPVAYEWTGTRA